MKKTCFKCKKELPITSFYAHKQTADRHLGKCKECTKKDAHENYIKDINASRIKENKRYKRRMLNPVFRKYKKEYGIQYYKRHPERIKWNNVKKVINRKKTNYCQICNQHRKKSEIHGHHENYKFIKEVIWVCPPCHHKIHRQKKEDKINI